MAKKKNKAFPLEEFVVHGFNHAIPDRLVHVDLHVDQLSAPLEGVRGEYVHSSVSPALPTGQQFRPLDRKYDIPHGNVASGVVSFHKQDGTLQGYLPKAYNHNMAEITDVREIIRSYYGFFESPVAKLKAIRKGLEAHAIVDLLRVTGATQMDLAQMLSLTEPTLRKYIKQQVDLNTGLSEHIIQLFELFDKGMDTFGSLEEFKNWLPHHNIGINAKPIELLDTITGINMVMNELLRIDHGVLA